MNESLLIDMAELYKTFGDFTRLKIIYVLLEEERCVQEIADLVTMSQSAVSHQLRILKQMKLIRSRKAGKTVFYHLSDEHVKIIFEIGREHIEEI